MLRYQPFKHETQLNKQKNRQRQQVRLQVQQPRQQVKLLPRQVEVEVDQEDSNKTTTEVLVVETMVARVMVVRGVITMEGVMTLAQEAMILDLEVMTLGLEAMVQTENTMRIQMVHLLSAGLVMSISWTLKLHRSQPFRR